MALNMIVISSILVVLLISTLYVVHEKQMRRTAEAKLEIVTVVGEIEKMMLDRKICVGNLCHDKFHNRMLAAQYAEHFGISLKSVFFPKNTEEWEKEKEMIHQEIQQDTELGKLLRRYIAAAFKAFSNEQPISAILFWVWVIVRAGGLIMLLACLFALLKAITFTESAWISIRKKRQEFKSNTLECYAATRMQIH
jgi:hypothetical protein